VLSKQRTDKFPDTTVDDDNGMSLLLSRLQQEFRLHRLRGLQQWRQSAGDDGIERNERHAELGAMKDQVSQWQQEQDYVQFQLQELEKAGLDEMNQDELESELNTLQHADHIRQALNGAGEILDGVEHSILSRLASAKNILAKVSSHNVAITEYHNRLESGIIELRELSRDIESFASGVHSDEKRAEQIGERLCLRLAVKTLR
jgi:DNA repair ATPase RecN